MGRALTQYGQGKAARDISDIRVRLNVLSGTKFVDVETGSGISSHSVSGADVMIPAWYIEVGSVQSSHQISGADIRIPAFDTYSGVAKSPRQISGADVFTRYPLYIETGTVVSAHGASGTTSNPGIAGRIAEYVTDTTLKASTLIKSGAGVLTLSAASAYTVTASATGTMALMLDNNSGDFGVTGTIYTDHLYPVGSGGISAKVDIQNNAVVQEILELYTSVTGGSAAGFGARLKYSLDSSTNLNQQAAVIDALWNVATHASRVADLVLSAAYSGGLSEGLRIRGGSGVAIGLYGVTPVVRAATGGSAAAFVQGSGNAVNDASTFGGYTLGQVVKALQDIGLLT